jgi:hypothetical protein
MRNELLARAAGVSAVLEVFPDRVIIQRTSGCLFMRRTNAKTIPIAKLSAVEFSPAGKIGSGYIQFVIAGSPERKGGTIAALGDENTVAFRLKDQPLFEQAREIIEEKLA